MRLGLLEMSNAFGDYAYDLVHTYAYIYVQICLVPFPYVCTSVFYPPHGCLLICCVSICLRAYLYEQLNNASNTRLVFSWLLLSMKYPRLASVRSSLLFQCIYVEAART